MSLDTQAEAHFQQFSLQVRPIVQIVKGPDAEDFPDGFGLEVVGTKEAIDACLLADEKKRLPTAEYFKFLEHWGAIVLKGSWGEYFLRTKENDKTCTGRPAVKTFNPEEGATPFRLHKDPSLIFPLELREMTIEQIKQGPKELLAQLINHLPGLLIWPSWDEGANFWLPGQERPQANTFITPDRSFFLGLAETIPQKFDEDLKRKRDFILELLKNAHIVEFIENYWSKMESPIQKATNIEAISSEDLLNRLRLDYYTGFMLGDRSRALTVKSRLFRPRLDRALSSHCKSNIQVSYRSPTIATWWDGKVTHKGVSTGMKGPPVPCQSFQYATKSGFYF